MIYINSAAKKTKVQKPKPAKKAKPGKVTSKYAA